MLFSNFHCIKFPTKIHVIVLQVLQINLSANLDVRLSVRKVMRKDDFFSF